MNELSWPWIAQMLVVPSLAAVQGASLWWRQSQVILGNIAGTTVRETRT